MTRHRPHSIVAAIRFIMMTMMMMCMMTTRLRAERVSHVMLVMMTTVTMTMTTLIMIMLNCVEPQPLTASFRNTNQCKPEQLPTEASVKPKPVAPVATTWKPIIADPLSTEHISVTNIHTHERHPPTTSISGRTIPATTCCFVIQGRAMVATARVTATRVAVMPQAPALYQ